MIDACFNCSTLWAWSRLPIQLSMAINMMTMIMLKPMRRVRSGSAWNAFMSGGSCSDFMVAPLNF